MADAIINVNKSYNLESHDHNDNIPLSVKLYYNPENVDNYRRIEHYADRGRHEAHTTHGSKLHKGSRYALLGLSEEHGHGHHGEGESNNDDDNDENSSTTHTISTETNDPCEIFRNKISRATITTLRTDLPASSDNSLQDQTDHTELAHKFTTLISNLQLPPGCNSIYHELPLSKRELAFEYSIMIIVSLYFFVILSYYFYKGVIAWQKRKQRRKVQQMVADDPNRNFYMYEIEHYL